MSKIFILSIFLANFLFPIGLRALVIPQSALSLSSSNAGIANAMTSEINPASLHTNSRFFGFSNNHWFGDLKGQKIMVSWNEEKKSHFSFESLSVNDIELRNEIASESPIGFFGAYWYSFDFSKTLNLKKLKEKDINAGYKIKYNLSKLYTESMYGLTLDFGLTKKIKDNLAFGFVAKNFGKEYTGELNATTPTILGIGVSYQFVNIPINILADLLHQDKKILNKFSFRTNFKHVNFICGITKSENYDDFSFGLKVDMKDWSLVFASLSHSKDVLGSPTYVELINKF